MTSRLLQLLILVDGLIWLRSSFGKVTGGTFVSGLGGTLGKFSDKNPYPPVKSFLEGVAIPNASVFGLLTMWGEVLVAVALAGGVIYLLTHPKGNTTVLSFIALGLIGGMFLNLIFWLAAGWTSPSADSLNLLMFATQFIALIGVIQVKKG